MGLFSALSGVGSIADAVTAISGVIKQALGMAHDKEQRNEGAIAQRETSDAATLDTINQANAPIANADADSMWNANKAKYVAPDGKS